ncbi:MAG: alpha/beta hydrolase family protein [Planctomyces sp.]
MPNDFRLPQQHLSGVVRPSLTRFVALVLIFCVEQQWCQSQTDKPASADSDGYTQLMRTQGAALRADDKAPTSSEDWAQQRKNLREDLLTAWGGFPEEPYPLNPQVLGTIQRDGYRIERIVFQTMPDVWMTANAWIPEQKQVSAKQQMPAVLCVHGHWPGAKQDPVVQARCIGLAKLGFFVLCVDAFGAGERAVGKKLGEYHGEMTGAMLLPVGKPLSGIQVYENRRAVDYLQTRPEVDPQRIGITGASGGGNQTMYAGGFDERFRCVVPTCSVGTWQAYLHAACCMCEVVPGGLRFSEEGNILGLSADRGLMVTSATKDAYQFSVDQARISVERARIISGLTTGQEVRHTIIESPHHYNQPMREAMYGWMTKHLKGEGSGDAIQEPEIQTEDPETLRCYPGESRPDDFVTIPEFAYRLGTELTSRNADISQLSSSESLQEWQKTERKKLQDVLGLGDLRSMNGLEQLHPAGVKETSGHEFERITFQPEPGLSIFALLDPVDIASSAENKSSPRPLAVVMDIDLGAESAFRSAVSEELRKHGWRIAAPELRATGTFRIPSDRIGNAPDHNSAEWAMWVGRPLLGQWVTDVRQTVDAISLSDGVLPEKIAVIGFGSSGVTALATAALDERITSAVAIRSLSSYVSRSPYRYQHLGIMVPGILSHFGDIQHLAALAAPRQVCIADATTATGTPMSESEIQQTFSPASEIHAKAGSSNSLRLITESRVAAELTEP